MKEALLLGAGRVATPLIKYLLEKGMRVRVASKVFTRDCHRLSDSSPNCVIEPFDVDDDAHLERLVSRCDLAISLLPFVFHPTVAELCISHKKDMVTASYVSPEMRALGERAEEAGVLLLNEIGLDPGIDHMSAMRVVDRVHRGGGKVVSFKSYCGGLPAMQNNNNPFGYKFSWSPRGVMMAGTNNGQFLEDGKVVFIPARDLFKHYMILDVEDIATFEAYTNRDALPYREIYGLNGAKTVFRGTLRNVGWCYKMKKVQELGLFDDSPRGDLEGLTYRGLMLRLIGQQESKDIVADTARYLGVEKHATVMKRFQWLGLFDDKPLPDEDNVMDMFCALLQEKLAMGKDDLDLIVLHHQFVAEYPGRSELLTSTLVNTGLPDGDSAMARTVGLPAAIAAAMILEGELSLTGVRIPVLPEIYEPVLAELERREIRIEERVRPLEVEDELRVGIY